MPLLASRVGYTLAVLYLCAAVFVVHTEIRAPGGDWIKLSGMGTFIITIPSQGTVGFLLTSLGVPRVNFDDPGFTGYSQLLVHVLVTGALVYLIGAGLEWSFRHFFVTSSSASVG